MTSHRDRASGGQARFRPQHIAGLLLFYTVLTFCVLAFVFFFVYTGVEFRLVILLTLAIGIVATVVHVKRGRRTRIDTLIDRGP
jgi:hypothetical protein